MIFMIPEIVTSDDENFVLELSKLGLNPEWFKEISEKILIAFNQTTLNDAASAPGSYAYFAAVRSVRDFFCPMGWKIVRRHGLELTENEKLNISILVSSGNKDTGNKNKIPKTKNPKGQQTISIVDHNAKCELFYAYDQNNITKIIPKPFWIFLYHIDKNKEEMRIEVSLPIEMDFYNTRVESWKKRIILPPVDFNPTPVLDDPDFVSDFEFEIKRKVNE